MRFYTVLQARPQYYDRNPTPSAQSYSVGGIAPHVITARWTYTVPAGKKAFVEAQQSFVIRDVVPTTAGTAGDYMTYTPSGGSALVLSMALIDSAVLGAATTNPLSSIGLLSAGDAITGNTFDNSTGGTCNHTIAAKYTQFDA